MSGRRCAAVAPQELPRRFCTDEWLNPPFLPNPPIRACTHARTPKTLTHISYLVTPSIQPSSLPALLGYGTPRTLLTVIALSMRVARRARLRGPFPFRALHRPRHVLTPVRRTHPQVELPIDPGVVLLDIGFTGTDPNHGAPSMFEV